MNASEVLTAAKLARESLAKGLGALQTDPNVPPALMELAAPIAQAMGALHQIERSGGAQLLPHADVALTQVRAALAQLQTQPPTIAAVANAMEAVASSLGQVHSLHLAAQALPSSPQLAAPGSASSSQVAAPPATPMHEPRRGGTAIMSPEDKSAHRTGANPAVAANTHAAAAYAPTAEQAHVGYHAAPAPQAAPQPAYQAPMPVPMIQQPPMVRSDPFRAPDPFGAPQALQPAMISTPQIATPQTPPGKSIPAPPANDFPMVNADLGAHSPTNFYKGLSGNDIIDHGGIFIATYKIPKLSTDVRIRVALPGGYEFEANGVVRWVREHAEGADVPPGFGAQFTGISAEARQLVYRYVRNREPIFHDDM